MASEPNDLFRAARETFGMTQGQVAELANAQVELATGKSGAMDADYIGRLERGIPPLAQPALPGRPSPSAWPPVRR